MKNKKHIQNIILSALFAAIIALLSQIAVYTPFGVPFTLQTFAVAFCGYFLGAKLSLLSVTAYIFIGAVGIPVFSQFRGGIGALFSASGGYLIGFLLLALFCGLCQKKENTVKTALFGAIGLLLCHTLGALWISIVSEGDVFASLLTFSLPFLLKDILSLILARFSAKLILKRLPKLLNEESL